MKRLLTQICVVAVLVGACSEDKSPTDSNPPNNQAVHDTLAIHTPPPSGGLLDGTWKTDDLRLSSSCFLMQVGFRGVYQKLFWTDLRIDGTRVWFKADEPDGGWRHRFNGTKSDSTIVGWMGTWYWSLSQGEKGLIGYFPVTFRKQS